MVAVSFQILFPLFTHSASGIEWALLTVGIPDQGGFHIKFNRPSPIFYFILFTFWGIT